MVAGILKKGDADLIGMGRALLCEPDFVRKTMDGRQNETRRCIVCCYCFDQMSYGLMRMTKMDLKCVFNPEFGHEGERLVQPAKQKKRVIIVGGGMIGVETAEFLADQNRKVTVIEMLQLIASDVGITTRWGLVSRLRKKLVYAASGIL